MDELLEEQLQATLNMIPAYTWYRWFLARYNPLRDDQGQIIRWYVACTDIDDRKRAEERLRQENVALREEVDKASMFEEIVAPRRR